MWSRLGSPLSADFVRTDGSRYASATGYEFEEAVSAWRTQGRPRILAYRKTAPMVLDDDPAPVTMLVVIATVEGVHCDFKAEHGSADRCFISIKWL